MTNINSNGIALQAGDQGVLMLHGLGASSLELTRLAKDLHEQGFSVRAPDLQGYCYGTPAEPWQNWMEQTQEHLWEMRKRYETVSVVGVSMGATLGLMLAERESLTSLVVLSAALSYDGWAIPWYQFLMDWTQWIPFSHVYKYKERDPFGIKNDETRAMVKRMMKLDHISESGAETITLASLKEGRKCIAATLSNIGDIDSPTLIMHAVDDESVHIRSAERVFDQIRIHQKEFVYLGDSYHMITIDNERETVHQETTRFLKKMVNERLNRKAFDVPGMLSPELRRYLKKLAA
jgi:carboxylesterase